MSATSDGRDRGVRLVAVQAGGTSDPWVAAGFACDLRTRVPLRNGTLEFTGGSPGLSGLTVDSPGDVVNEIEGIPLHRGKAVPAVDHPNGCYEIDHLVILTDLLERTSHAVTQALGLECRRVRETDEVRQGFHRFGERGAIIEIVERSDVRRVGLFGVVFNTIDLDGAIERLGPDSIGAARPAVQPGRRIATVRRGAGLGVPTALMTPDTR